jgi:hypothetical protein
VLTPCLVRSSLERAAVMTFLLMWEGAEKCALRHLRRAEDTAALNFIAAITNQTRKMLDFDH